MDCRTGFPFEQAPGRGRRQLYLRVQEGVTVKGLIAPDFPYLSIAREYETAGASCVSVLTEPKWFLGPGPVSRRRSRRPYPFPASEKILP